MQAQQQAYQKQQQQAQNRVEKERAAQQKAYTRQQHEMQAQHKVQQQNYVKSQEELRRQREKEQREREQWERALYERQQWERAQWEQERQRSDWERDEYERQQWERQQWEREQWEQVRMPPHANQGVLGHSRRPSRVRTSPIRIFANAYRHVPRSAKGRNVTTQLSSPQASHLVRALWSEVLLPPNTFPKEAMSGMVETMLRCSSSLEAAVGSRPIRTKAEVTTGAAVIAVETIAVMEDAVVMGVVGTTAVLDAVVMIMGKTVDGAVVK